MNEKRLYKDFFKLPEEDFFHSSVTAYEISENIVNWKGYFPNGAFVRLLQQVHKISIGDDSRSLWLEGSYGVGKSYAVYALKSLLETDAIQIESYFKHYNLDRSLCQRLISDKNNQKIIIAYNYGTVGIHTDIELLLSVQECINEALERNKLKKETIKSFKAKTIDWLMDEKNRAFFDALITQEKYAWDFVGDTSFKILDKLQSQGNAWHLLSRILLVASENEISELRYNKKMLYTWIQDVLKENEVDCLLLIWDEISDYLKRMDSDSVALLELLELSLSCSLYFLIVALQSYSIFDDKNTAKRVMDKFMPPILIGFSDNEVFQLIDFSIKKNLKPILTDEWNKYASELNEFAADARNFIQSNVDFWHLNIAKVGSLNEELCSVVPIHPYAAFLLKHIAGIFAENQRTIMEFILGKETLHGFRYYINHYGPIDSDNLFTVDMLWDYSVFLINNNRWVSDKDDINKILIYVEKQTKLLEKNQIRVLKVIALLYIVSQRVSGVQLFRPNGLSVEMAFRGMGWSIGKGKSIADKLCRDGVIFKALMENGEVEYTLFNVVGDANTIEELKQQIKNDTKNTIINDDLLSAVFFPASIRERFELVGATADTLEAIVGKNVNFIKPNRYKCIVVFAIDEEQLDVIQNEIVVLAASISENIVLIPCMTMMGREPYENYVENMAYSHYYEKKDKARSRRFERNALRYLNDWKDRVSDGGFCYYDETAKALIHLESLYSLQKVLKRIEYQKYPYSLSQYDVIDNMFVKGPLAQGAECGIKQELVGTYKSAKKEKSLDTVLRGAWKQDGYWLEDNKQDLIISKIKNEVRLIVERGFEESGKISVFSIFDKLEDAPYGFVPNNIAAFVLGFVLKEYVSTDYYWSDGVRYEEMSVEKMKGMIANAMNQKVAPIPNYRDEYIAIMNSSYMNKFNIQDLEAENQQLKLEIENMKLKLELENLRRLLNGE